MSIFKKVAGPGKYQDDRAIYDVVSYILRPGKTPSDIIGGRAIDENNIAGSMVSVSESFKKNSRIRLHHFIVSFMPHEVYSKGALICMAETICKYIGQEYQIIYVLHEDNYYPHLHFVFNAISYIDGHRYRGGRSDYHNLVYTVSNVVRQYGVTTFKAVNYIPGNNPHE